MGQCLNALLVEAYTGAVYRGAYSAGLDTCKLQIHTMSWALENGDAYVFRSVGSTLHQEQ